jgi:SAM-dependent methyltransferase
MNNNHNPSLHIIPTPRYSVYSVTHQPIIIAPLKFNAKNNNADHNDDHDDNTKFKTKEYWDKRFTTEPTYEWLGTFKDFQHSLTTCAQIPFDNNEKTQLDILFVGTGNSSFPNDFLNSMSHPEVCYFCNIDFSPVVIDQQRKRFPNMEWLTMDMTALTFPSSRKFDIVIDKAAMDSIVVDRGDPWDPSDNTKTSVDGMMKSIANVLKPGGKFVSIGFEQPIHRKIHFMRNFLLDVRWEPHFDVQNVDVGMGYFCYVLKMKS